MDSLQGVMIAVPHTNRPLTISWLHMAVRWPAVAGVELYSFSRMIIIDGRDAAAPEDEKAFR